MTDLQNFIEDVLISNGVGGIYLKLIDGGHLSEKLE